MNKIHMEFYRCKDGVRVTVEVAEEVEEHFKYHGGGEREAVRNYSRLWRPVDDKAPLDVWSYPIFNGPRDIYTLYSVGDSLIVDTDLEDAPRRRIGLNGQLNLSFIRLVNASKPGGVSFIIDTVQNAEYLEELAFHFKRAGRRFYQDFLEPVRFKVTLTKSSA